jgi:uncharacterized membrane protein
MKAVIDWIWNGPWWAPLVGAVYISAFLGIALGPLWGAMNTRRR